MRRWRLRLLEGERLPEWTSAKRGSPGHYGGRPGRAFALLLEGQ